MNTAKTLDTIALVLVIIGGINWGLVGLFSYDLVSTILLGKATLIEIVYTLVGVSALYLIFVAKKLGRR